MIARYSSTLLFAVHIVLLSCILVLIFCSTDCMVSAAVTMTRHRVYQELGISGSPVWQAAQYLLH